MMDSPRWCPQCRLSQKIVQRPCECLKRATLDSSQTGTDGAHDAKQETPSDRQKNPTASNTHPRKIRAWVLGSAPGMRRIS